MTSTFAAPGVVPSEPLASAVDKSLLEFDPVKARMEAFIDVFDTFLTRQRQTVMDSVSTVQEQLAANEDTCRSLINQIELYAKKEDEQNKEIVRDEQEIARARLQIETLSGKKNEMVHSKEELSEQMEQLLAKIKQKQQENLERKAALRANHEKNVPQLEMYERLLGLRIIGGSSVDLLRFQFCNIDNINHGKVFEFDLDLSCYDYNVPYSNPQIPSEKLQEILLELNQTRNLLRFFKAIRAEFKSIA